MSDDGKNKGPKPGICVPWEEKVKDLPRIQGSEELLKKVWEDHEALAHMYIWHCLVSF